MKYFKSSYVFKGITVTNTWIPAKNVSLFKPITQVYGVVFDDENNILICRENTYSKWQMPGGTPEGKETIQETLERELKEEVNIVVKDIKALGVQEVSMPNNPKKDIGDVFYQVRCIALLEKINKQIPDPDTGNTWERKFVPASKINEYVKWGETGAAMFEDAKKLYGDIKQLVR